MRVLASPQKTCIAHSGVFMLISHASLAHSDNRGACGMPYISMCVFLIADVRMEILSRSVARTLHTALTPASAHH